MVGHGRCANSATYRIIVSLWYRGFMYNLFCKVYAIKYYCD